MVNRSNALQGFRYGRHFLFTERQRVGNPVLAVAGSFLLGLGSLLFIFAPTRYLLRLLLPRPGQGPSREERDSGFFSMGLWAEVVDESNGARSIVRGTVNAPHGDPGYKETSKMVAEAAVCLALDGSEKLIEEKAVTLPASYGVLTPSTALGAVYRERLNDRGIHFSVAGP